MAKDIVQEFREFQSKQRGEFKIFGKPDAGVVLLFLAQRKRAKLKKVM